MNSVHYRQIPAELVRCFPELGDQCLQLYEEYPEAGAYNFLAEVFGPFMDAALKSRAHATLLRIFSFIERLATSEDAQVVNFAQAGICEYLGRNIDRYRASRVYMGPSTRELSEATKLILNLPDDDES